MGLIHLGCPSCGGTLSLAEGQRLVTCQYCGGESLALIPGTVPRHVVAMGISREAALAAAQKVLARPGLPRALRESGRIQEVSLCYVPFYEFTGARLGTFLLKDGVQVAPVPAEEGGQGPDFQFWVQAPLMQKEDTRVIQQEVVRVGPACDTADLGVDAIHLENMRRGPSPVALEPYDVVTLQSRATVLAPTKPPARFIDDSQMRIKVQGDRTGVMEQRLKLLYYPVWQARYRHVGRPYEIAVDGVTGRVLRARVPVEIRQAGGIAIGALALAAFGFGRPARQLLQAGLPVGNLPGWLIGALGSLVVLALGGAMALFLSWVAWVTFRQGGEALLDEEAGRPLIEGDWGPGPLGQMRAKLAEWALGSGMGSGGRG
jgi:DNA-directed RNA polymerase subunit RPC12/RpoP